MNRSRDERLEQFRSEWPKRLSWAEVRADDPQVFRMAATGVWLVVAAVPATLLWTALALGFPFAIHLPDWGEWSRGLLTVALMWGGIMLWLIGVLMLTMPSDARRALSIERFAEERELHFSRYGFAPPRVGIMFAEGRAARPPRRLRDRASAAGSLAAGRPADPADPAADPLFRAEFALWKGRDAYAPDLQLAVASYSGDKGDPRGPKQTFRYLSSELPRVLPHLVIDSRRNGSLRHLLPGVQRLSLEGDFDRYFTVYAPEGYARDALELLTPDVMACLIDHGRSWDLEIVEDRLIVVSTRVLARSDRAETTALLRFSELVAEELGHQARSYTDPRAKRPRSQIAEAGRRLRIRTAAWGTAILVGSAAVLLGFPWVLGWLLDR